MATLTTTKNYADGTLLFASDIDDFLNDIEYFLNTTKISDSNIQSASLTASSVLADGALTTSKFQANSVTAAKLASSSVDTANILNDAVTTIKILDDAVTAAKVDNLAVTNVKIVNNNVTNVKRAAVNWALSSSSGNSQNSTTSDVDVVSTSFTTNGRPVQLILISDGSVNPSKIGLVPTGGVVSRAVYSLYRDSTMIAQYSFSAVNPGTLVISSSAINFLDTTVTEGTYTYKLKHRCTTASTTCTTYYCKLFVREL